MNQNFNASDAKTNITVKEYMKMIDESFNTIKLQLSILKDSDLLDNKANVSIHASIYSPYN